MKRERMRASEQVKKRRELESFSFVQEVLVSDDK